MNDSTSNFCLEESLQTLENIVSHMEKDVLSIESTLSQYEKGIKLIRQCQTALQQAEQKVRLLTEKNGQAELINFNDATIEQ